MKFICCVNPVSGTWALNLFDRFHLGHEILVERLSQKSEPVAAVTTGELIEHELELASIIQPTSYRVEKLNAFLESINLSERIKIKEIHKYEDFLEIPGKTTFMMYIGPCCTDVEKRGLELREAHLGINDEVEYLKPVRADDGKKLSSARIRKGEIDQQGHRLNGTQEPPRKLDLETRRDLKTPKGTVYDAADCTPEKEVIARIQEQGPACVIAVGDVTSSTLLQEGYVPDVAIVDGKTKRGPFEESFSGEKEYHAYNPAGMLYPEAWSVVDTAIHDGRKSVIFIEGEEDLIGFPATILAPEGSVMLYGQPNVGIVWVPVKGENRNIAREFLGTMPVISD
jgi:GTP-dependent dephospho-CoA kinase